MALKDQDNDQFEILLFICKIERPQIFSYGILKIFLLNCSAKLLLKNFEKAIEASTFVLLNGF
jgi:hypothetical protein